MPPWFAGYSASREGEDPGSVLNLYRKALHMRRTLQDKTENMEWIGEPSDACLHFARPGGWQIVMNFGVQAGLELPQGELLLVSSDLEEGRLPLDATAWLRSPI
jgi:alpha-glucosidase